MNKKKIIRLELLLLALVTLLLAYRVVEGPPAPEGLVVHTHIKPNEIQHSAFALDQPVRISIDAAGSYSSDEHRDGLAAYGWILHRESRNVVWRMDAENTIQGRGTLALVADTLDLAPGTYDVYFTTYGNENGSRFGGIDFLNRFLGGDTKWKDDEDDWKMIVRRADGVELPVHKLEGQTPEELSPRGQGLLWSTAPMESRREAEFVFRVAEPLKVFVYAIGEIENNRMDYGWIENAVNGVRKWEMTQENTTPAGGWIVNRLFRDSLSFDPGVYRAVFTTDARQSYDDWVGNPPYDPAGWGITLFSDHPEAVTAFDAWADRQPIVTMVRVGDSEKRTAQFKVTKPVDVVTYAVGEMSDDSRYDYGWIKNNETQETIWEMTYSGSRPTSGDNNRVEIAFLKLVPATYTATYVTDDSHSFDSWAHGTPDHPDRWGLTIFPMSESFDTTSVQLLGYGQESNNGDMQHPDLSREHAPMPPMETTPLPPQPGISLVDLTSVGNEKHLTGTFTLDQTTQLHVRSEGEVSLSGRYDYGWIEKSNTGEIVWEMSWQNTMPAGGDDRNRMFDGPIQLDPGSYTVHFKTDFNHSFGDFGEQAPRSPASWGIKVTKP